ncbi:hypothetical protein TeGR_g1208, partial [Tetraparma gracilis]
MSDQPMEVPSDSSSEPVSVFVGGFGKDNATVPQLEELFEDHNLPVAKVDIKRGFAFVYVSPGPALAATIPKMNGTVTLPSGGTQFLRIELAAGGRSGGASSAPGRANIPPSATLFVVNFDVEGTTRENLKELFEPFGELRRVDIQKNYAFVEFTTVDAAVAARDGTNGGKLNQNTLSVEYSEPKPPRPRGADERRGPPPPGGG